MKTLLALIISLGLVTASMANDTGVWYDPVQDGHGITLFEFSRGGEQARVFWWFTFTAEGEREFFMSSVEIGESFLLYSPTVKNPEFPTGTEVVPGDPVGTADLVALASGGFLFAWDVLVEEVTCEDKYGAVPPGPRDPACLDSDKNFVPGRILVEGFFEQGSARFQRLTPAQ